MFSLSPVVPLLHIAVGSLLHCFVDCIALPRTLCCGKIEMSAMGDEDIIAYRCGSVWGQHNGSLSRSFGIGCGEGSFARSYGEGSLARASTDWAQCPNLPAAPPFCSRREEQSQRTSLSQLSCWLSRGMSCHEIRVTTESFTRLKNRSFFASTQLKEFWGENNSPKPN